MYEPDGAYSSVTSTFSVFMFSTCEWRMLVLSCLFLGTKSSHSTFTPLIASAIFFAANGEFHISYIDSLYNCVSAMVVCGLATIDLSELTGFQQAVLFVLQCMGSPVVVSWVMVYVRRRYFARKFEHIVEAEIARRKALIEAGDRVPMRRSLTNWGRRMSTAFTPGGPDLEAVVEEMSEKQVQQEKASKENGNALHDASRVSSNDEKKHPFGGLFGKKGLKLKNVRTDMIRRVETAPQPIDPSGWISTEAKNENAMIARNRPREALPKIDEKSQLKESDGRASDRGYVVSFSSALVANSRCFQSFSPTYTHHRREQAIL